MRYAIALVLWLVGAASASAQVCPPIPALPDTERRTQYSATAQTGPFSVGFQLYGDSTDYGNWIGVYVNGVLQNPMTYTVTSPTTTLATGCRPITDAVVNFTAAQTGTIQIVGARRPRRASQFGENAGVPARSINQVVTDLVAQNREQWDQLLRTLQAPPGETLSILPPVASRANKFLAFDASGNPLPTVGTGGTGLPGANGCLSNARLAKVNTYTVGPADTGSTIALGGGAFYTAALADPSTYPATFCAILLNEDTSRGKLITVFGGTDFVLYPGQTAFVFNQNNVWRVHRNKRWVPAGPLTVFFDPAGSASNDCLAAGAANACPSLQVAWDLAANNFDLSGNSITFFSSAAAAWTNSGLATAKPLVGSAGPQACVIDFNGSTSTMNNGNGTLEIGFGVGAPGWGCTIQNVTCVGSGGSGCFNLFRGTLRVAGGVTFGTVSASHMKVGHSGNIQVASGYTIAGGATVHYDSQTNSLLATDGITVSCGGGAWPFAIFADGSDSGNLSAAGMTFTSCASVTGIRSAASENSVIHTNTSAATCANTYFPGSIAGGTSTGGQCN